MPGLILQYDSEKLCIALPSYGARELETLSQDAKGHMVFVPHRPAYFTQHNALQFHPCCCKGYKMQTGEATVENSIEFPQKTKNGTTL